MVRQYDTDIMALLTSTNKMSMSGQTPLVHIPTHVTLTSNSNCGNVHKILRRYTLQPLYNRVHYNMVLDITWFKDGS